MSAITCMTAADGPSDDVVMWCQSVGLFLRSGVAVDDAVELSWHQSKEIPFRDKLDLILSRIMSGRRLSSAMAECDSLFPKRLVEAVAAGEESGQLSEILLRWSEAEKRRRKLLGDIRSALIYPLCVLSAALLIFGFLSLFVLPKVIGLFTAHGGNLPTITKLLLSVQGVVSSPVFLLYVLSLVLLAAAALGNERCKRLRDGLLLKLPIVGPIWRSYLISDFCRYFALFLTGGASVPKALSLAGGIGENEVLRDCARKARKGVSAGKDLQTALQAEAFFPADVLSLISTGAQTDELPFVMEQAAETHGNMAETAAKRAISFIEPLVVSLLGLAVAVMVAAIYLPILRLATAIVN